MANMSKEKVKMPEQDPMKRNKNFNEVALGYTEEMANLWEKGGLRRLMKK